MPHLLPLSISTGAAAVPANQPAAAPASPAAARANLPVAAPASPPAAAPGAQPAAALASQLLESSLKGAQEGPKACQKVLKCFQRPLQGSCDAPERPSSLQESKT